MKPLNHTPNFPVSRAQKREQAPRTPNALASAPRASNFAKRLECVLAVCKDLAGAFHLTAMIISAILLMISPASAHAQGGVPLWTNRYNGPANDNTFPEAIAVDRNGNVFVTGVSSDGPSTYGVTIAYSNAGTLLWTNLTDFLPGAIAVDVSGNVFVTGGAGETAGASDYATVAYSNTGVPLWTNRYYGEKNYDGARAIAVDTSGNVFVTGDSSDANGNLDYATIAYSNSGLPLWTNRYDGPPNGVDAGTAIAVDSGGNVFVTGASFGVASFDDYATIKYSNTGQPLWTNRYDGGLDYLVRIALDSSGNVFVTGSSATVAYSNSGVPLWTNRNGGYATAIAVDGNGNVFVTESVSTPSSAEDYATIKYSNAGVPLWTNRYNGPANGADIPSGMAVDSAGNVFVTGWSFDRSNSSDFRFSDYLTVAYSNTAMPLWTNRYNGPANDEDVAEAIAVDRNGSVFVTGYSKSTNGTFDIVTIKYSSSVPPPRLDFQTLNNQLVLSWTNAGFNLQAAPAVTGPFTNLLGATSPYTNVTTRAQQFFRLIGN